MFESDQHEFDEGFDELGHVTPPPPLAKSVPEPARAAVSSGQDTADDLRAMLKSQPSPLSSPSVALAPAATAAPVAVAEPEAEEAEEEEEEEFEEEQEIPEFTDPAERSLEEIPPPPPKKNFPIWMIGGFAVLIGFAIFV